MLNKKHLSFQKLYLSNKRRESFGTVTASCCWMVEIHPFPQKILCLLPQAWRIIVLWGLRDPRMHHKVRASMSTINHCFIVGSHYFHQLGQSSTINPEWKSVYSWLWFHRHTVGQFAHLETTKVMVTLLFPYLNKTILALFLSIYSGRHNMQMTDLFTKKTPENKNGAHWNGADVHCQQVFTAYLVYDIQYSVPTIWHDLCYYLNSQQLRYYFHLI